MGLSFPPQLNWLTEMLGDGSFPEGDEDKMRAQAARLTLLAAWLGDTGDELAGEEFAGSSASPSLSRYALQLSGLGEDLTRSALDQAQSWSDQAENLEFSKLQIIMGLSITAGYVIGILSDWFELPMLPAFLAGARAAMQRLLMEYLGRAVALVEAAASGAALGALPNVSAQLIQMRQGTRADFDPGSFGESAGLGALAGVVGLHLHGLVSRYGPIPGIGQVPGQPPVAGGVEVRELVAAGVSGVGSSVVVGAVSGGPSDESGQWEGEVLGGLVMGAGGHAASPGREMRAGVDDVPTIPDLPEAPDLAALSRPPVVSDGHEPAAGLTGVGGEDARSTAVGAAHAEGGIRYAESAPRGVGHDGGSAAGSGTPSPLVAGESREWGGQGASVDRTLPGDISGDTTANDPPNASAAGDRGSVPASAPTNPRGATDPGEVTIRAGGADGVVVPETRRPAVLTGPTSVDRPAVVDRPSVPAMDRPASATPEAGSAMTGTDGIRRSVDHAAVAPEPGPTSHDVPPSDSAPGDNHLQATTDAAEWTTGRQSLDDAGVPDLLTRLAGVDGNSAALLARARDVVTERLAGGDITEGSALADTIARNLHLVERRLADADPLPVDTDTYLRLAVEEAAFDAKRFANAWGKRLDAPDDIVDQATRLWHEATEAGLSEQGEMSLRRVIDHLARSPHDDGGTRELVRFLVDWHGLRARNGYRRLGGMRKVLRKPRPQDAGPSRTPGGVAQQAQPGESSRAGLGRTRSLSGAPAPVRPDPRPPVRQRTTSAPARPDPRPPVRQPTTSAPAMPPAARIPNLAPRLAPYVKRTAQGAGKSFYLQRDEYGDLTVAALQQAVDLTSDARAEALRAISSGGVESELTDAELKAIIEAPHMSDWWQRWPWLYNYLNRRRKDVQKDYESGYYDSVSREYGGMKVDIYFDPYMPPLEGYKSVVDKAFSGILKHFSLRTFSHLPPLRLYFSRYHGTKIKIRRSTSGESQFSITHEMDPIWSSYTDGRRRSAFFQYPDLIAVPALPSQAQVIGKVNIDLMDTIVHEVGHYVNFLNAPHVYVDLTDTVLTEAAMKTALKIGLYAADGGPREVPAEVFAQISSGYFSGGKEGMRLYLGLGGLPLRDPSKVPPPAALDPPSPNVPRRTVSRTPEPRTVSRPELPVRSITPAPRTLSRPAPATLSRSPVRASAAPVAAIPDISPRVARYLVRDPAARSRHPTATAWFRQRDPSGDLRYSVSDLTSVSDEYRAVVARGSFEVDMSDDAFRSLLERRRELTARYPQLYSYLRRRNRRLTFDESLPGDRVVTRKLTGRQYGRLQATITHESNDALAESHIKATREALTAIASVFPNDSLQAEVVISKYGGLNVKFDRNGNVRVVAGEGVTGNAHVAFREPNRIFLFPLNAASQIGARHIIRAFAKFAYHMRSPALNIDIRQTVWTPRGAEIVALLGLQSVARLDPREVVAVIYQRLVSGTAVDRRLMDLYYALDGPRPPGR
jgi:hypothetical protein